MAAVPDFDTCYRAVSSRDTRFDGQFFTAVRTTGIYCRPSCPAVTPKPANVSFLPTAAAAQLAGYRACRRCLPDASPGSPQWNLRSDAAARAMRLIVDGTVDRDGVSALAAQLGYSTRQLNRLVTSEYGAGPLAIARANRAQTARILIQTTSMLFTEVAFAAGFASIRQFNDTIAEVFAATPTLLRAASTANAPAASAGWLTLRLPLREPFHRGWFEWFVSAHCTGGIEQFATDGTFTRTLALPRGWGLARLRPRPGHIACELQLSDLRDLPPAIARLRHLLDLDADPAAVDSALATDPRLHAAVEQAPGLRVFGAPDGAELLIRTMIGQQISVAAARTHTSALVRVLGAEIPVAAADTNRLFPDATTIAERGRDVLRGPQRRIDAIVSAAATIAAGDIQLHRGRDAAELRRELLALSGVGPWTADYVTMRLLGAPDILLVSDLVARRGAGQLGIDLADSAAWRPWRSYASMHLWRVALDAVLTRPGRTNSPGPSTTKAATQ